MRVAVLGTGIMGAPMARNLAAAGHEVAVWNRTRAKAEAVAGARAAATPAVAVAGAEVVLTMLADGAAVEDVAEQALPAFAADAVWWQASTVGLEACERFAALAGEHGAPYVDAPVLGTKQPAEAGKLIVLASGEPEIVDRLMALFEAVGSTAIRLGEAGEGTRAKLVLNHWTLALTTAVAETIALAEAMGIEPDLYLEAIAGGPLDSDYAQLKGEVIIDGETGEASFPLRLAHKDAKLVLDAAVRHGADLGLAPAVAERFARAMEAGLGDSDLAAVALVSGERAPRP